MSKQYFGDILETGDKRMDYEVEKPFKMDDIKLLTLKVKSAPEKWLNLTQGTDMVKGKDAGIYDFKHKTEVKYAEGDVEVKLTATNKDFAIDAEVQPSDFNKDGMHSSFQVEAKMTPAKDDWEAKFEAKVGGFNLGPITPWCELQLDTNKSQEHELTYSQNFNFEKNFHAAWKLVADVNGKSLKEGYGILAWNNTEFGDWHTSEPAKKDSQDSGALTS